MHRFWEAVQAFLAVLRGKPTVPAQGQTPPVAAKPAPVRSEAIALLATLQQEARFLDFIMEPLTDYTDAQIGAAARDIHDKCRQTVAALFAIEPLSAAKEGASVTVPAGYDPVQYRLIGDVHTQGPFTGTVSHPGWVARKCELPIWTGRPESMHILGPTEVELAGGNAPTRRERA